MTPRFFQKGGHCRSALGHSNRKCATTSIAIVFQQIPSEVSMTKLLRFTKLLVYALSSLVFVAPAFAQDQAAVITGRVLSDQGQPVAGANVLISELNISVLTNQSGAYTI